jgi:hypothetical protein
MEVCCYDSVSVDSQTLILYLLFYYLVYVYVFIFKNPKIKPLLELGYGLISLVIICYSKTQFSMGSTSHLQNIILQMIHAIANIL